MKRIVVLVMFSAAAGSLVAAQMYRWVDEKGTVEYRDTPPPREAKKVEERRLGGNTIQTSTPSYSAQQAAKNYPVVLWAYECGDACTNARALLARRGVPYQERDPRGDLKAFEKLTGGTGVPVLYVGQARLVGYLESQWETTLDSAGYPKTASAAGITAPKPKPAAKAAPEQKAADKSAEKAADKAATPAGAQPPAAQPGQAAAK